MNFMFSAKELDKETGFYYYGARYLDPKYSRWISTDPAMNTGEYFPQAPVNDEAKKHNGNLPGMGGIFNHINGNLYHYAANNPIKYTDPDGRICYSYYDRELGKYSILTFNSWRTKGLNICNSLLDFYPFGIGTAGKRLSEFLTPYEECRLIDSSTPAGHFLSFDANNFLDKFGRLSDGLNFITIVGKRINDGAGIIKNIGKVSNFIGNISNYIINPALLGLSVGENLSALIDGCVVSIFNTHLLSNSRKGVEDKYKFARDKLLESLKDGTIQLYYFEEDKAYFYDIHNKEKFDLILKTIDEME